MDKAIISGLLFGTIVIANKGTREQESNLGMGGVHSRK
jgi:hypothetical protein